MSNPVTLYNAGPAEDQVLRHAVDRSAARVVSKGFQYVSRKRVQWIDREAPWPVRANPRLPNESPFVDLTGVKFGRFTVLGRHTASKHWVVRCSCGVHSLRKGKAVKNPSNSVDRCDECRHLVFLRRENIHKRDGVWVDWADI